MLYARNGVVYLSLNENGKRLRLSTGLKDSPHAREFIAKNSRLFVKNKLKALQEFHALQGAKFEFKGGANNGTNDFARILKALAREKQTLKFKTKSNFKSTCKEILDFVNFKGFKKIAEFQRENCAEFIGFLQAKNNRTTTIKRKIKAFESVFKYAVDCGLIAKSPLFMPKFTQSEAELESSECKPFDLGQMQVLIKSSKGELKSYLKVAFFTGLRTGELLGLKKDDLNLGESKAYIKRTLLNDGKSTNAPKTRSSYRAIDLLPIVAKELENKALQSDDSFLFKSPVKKLRAEFYALQERLKITPIRRLYDTRHSFASVMLSKGEEPMWISRVMLGHSSLTQTFKVYAKYLPKSVSERASFLKDMEF